MERLRRTLKEIPGQFIALSTFPEITQRRVCESAGVEDGGGMSDETFREVKQRLTIIDNQKNPLSDPARRCAAAVDRAYAKARAQRIILNH